MNGIITVIGLGEIGSSLAMAFKARGESCTVIGNDLRKDAERLAEGNKRVDRIEHNLFNAVKDADAVFLAVPADQTRQTLELIGHDLKKGAVVLDCCPDKSAAADWARQYLTEPENFLGVWMGINPECLSIRSGGGQTARPDLFRNGCMFIAAEPDSSEGAIKFAVSLAEMLGMDRAFSDPSEMDGMIAAVYHLPVLASNALLGCLSQRSGWADGKKTAGKLFAQMTAGVDVKMDQTDPGTSLLNNRENTVRLLNEYMAALKEIRDELKSKDEPGLRSMLDGNKQSLEQWREDRKRPKQASDGPAPAAEISASETMGQTFFGGLLRKKRKD